MWVLDKTLLNDIETRLTEQWQALPAPKTGRLLHCEVSLDGCLAGVTPKQWFQRRTSLPVLYWQNPEGTFETAGIGSAACFGAESHKDLESCMVAMQETIAGIDGAPRFYGGMAFDQTRPVQGLWSDFGMYRFQTPTFECRRMLGKTTLLVTLPVMKAQVSPVDAGMRELEGLVGQELDFVRPGKLSGPGQAVGSVREQGFCPTQAQWIESVVSLLERFDSDLNKLVLGCRETLRFQTPVRARRLFDAIAARGPAYQFYLGNERTAFMGTSPECLYGRCNNQLVADALAGTRQGTGSAVGLMHSDKDNREHDYVVCDMQEALACLCTEVHRIEHKQLLRWHDLEHLRSRFLGRLQGGVSDYRILDTLHPSAAVLGYARDRAWSMLRAEESFNRGWYAAPVGWIGRDAAEFAVAIRSALVHGDMLELYAGAGIVRGSDPQQEWNEILSKMNHFHEALGI